MTTNAQLPTPAEEASAIEAWVERYRPLVEKAFAVWLETGEWPSVEHLQRVLDIDNTSIAVLDAYSAMPRLGDQLRPLYPSTITLPLRTLHYLPAADSLLEVCLQIVRRGVEIYFSTADTPELRSDDSVLVERTGPNAALLGRAADLIRSDFPSPFGGGGWSDSSWDLKLHAQNAREFRDVASLDDYFARQTIIMTRDHFPRSDPPPTSTPASAVAPQAPHQASAFVLMPFTADWSADIYDLIKRAVDSLRPDVEISVLRADEIARPGKITDQIIEAIRESDIIVADITGNNPNVMWELGFAQALGKLPVILNQAIEVTPFDLHDWRQVIYSRIPTETDLIAIAKHLRDALTITA